MKGESSIGKTHLAKSVAEYFPQDDVWFIGDMSPKALIHEHGQYRNGKTYVSLRNKILIFLESPRKETLEMLKPILSHDRTEIEYKIADKKASGQLGTKSVIIEGWPATIFCTTDYRFLEELSTRSMLTTPEVTQEKIQQVLEYKAAQYSRPWENVEDEEERILKGALELLKSDIKICVPYAEVLAQKYGTDEPRVMRDFDKLLGLISMSTFLHKEQRMRFEISTGSTYVVANEYDYWIGVSLFGSVRETTCTRIPQPVIDFYENIVKRIEGVISYKSMRETYVKVHKKPLSRTHLRNRFVEPLESVGWLNREQDPNDKRGVIFEKCRIEPENTETMEEYDASYFKEIFPEEQLEKYMRELEKIWNKNEECNTGIDCGNGECDDCDCDTDYTWFYMEKVPYFLEENKNVNEGIKDENSMKNENSINPHNSTEIIVNNKMEENNLIDQYDEETVLLQIPQDDTRVKDVVKKFRDQNKVVDTIVVLKDKGKVIAGVINGQGYMRRVPDTPRIRNSDVPRPGLNRWTCGECGAKFYAQEPYRNRDDHAICDECAEKLIS